MAEALLRNGHKVTIVCGSSVHGDTGLDGPFLNGIRRGFIEGIEVIELELLYSNHLSLWQRSLIFLRYALQSIRIVLSENYDLVFATTTPLTAGIPGIFARWMCKKPFVFEVRDLWPELPKAMKLITNPLVLKTLSGLEWASYHSAQRLIGLSPGIVDGICTRGIREDRVSMIPNGCDHDFFNKESEPWRPEGVGQADLMAVFTGAHGLANGLEAVIAAAIELQRRNRTDIKLVLVGDGKLKPELQWKADQALLKNLIFYDPVPKPKLRGLLQAADLGMQILANVPAFYYGTSPNKFFDYIATGLPVLNNYPGWIAEIVEENSCGFVVSPHDPAAFADALESAADDRTELIKMGNNARVLAEKKFDRKYLADEFVDWIEGAKF